jgi:hypothetical protein
LISEGEHNRDWYKKSRRSISRYARAYDLTPGYVIDVLAILSPRVHVVRNISMAKEYIETGTIRRGVMQARLDALAHYEETGILKGPKINAFSRALRGDPDACVVDVWIFRAFGLISTHYANYVRAEKRVARAANRVGWAVAETQAAIWAGTREVCGFSNHSPMNMDS